MQSEDGNAGLRVAAMDMAIRIYGERTGDEGRVLKSAQSIYDWLKGAPATPYPQSKAA